jgi:hypothetical protein
VSAGLGASYGGTEQPGQGTRAAYVGLDDLTVEEPDEGGSGLDRADEAKAARRHKTCALRDQLIAAVRP